MQRQRSGAKKAAPRAKRTIGDRSVALGPGLIPAAAVAADERAQTGERIAHLRCWRSMTQLQLALAVGKSEKTIRNWEKGRLVTAETLDLLGGALNLPAAWVVGRMGSRSANSRANDPFEIQFERRVIDKLVERGVAPDTATLLLPTATTLVGLVVDAVAEFAETTLARSEVSAERLDTLAQAIEAVRNKVAELNPDELASGGGVEDARIYRAAWNCARLGYFERRPNEKTVLRGAGEMTTEHLESAARDLLHRLPYKKQLAVLRDVTIAAKHSRLGRLGVQPQRGGARARRAIREPVRVAVMAGDQLVGLLGPPLMGKPSPRAERAKPTQPDGLPKRRRRVT